MPDKTTVGFGVEAWMTDDGRVATDRTKEQNLPSQVAESFHIPLIRKSDATAALAQKDELAARLKLEAQCHAQEARTANATIAEIYQLCTGATGEPGNWNGAEPVRQALAVQQGEIERLRAQLSWYVDGRPDVHTHHCRACGLHYSPTEEQSEDCPRCKFNGVGDPDAHRAALEQSK